MIIIVLICINLCACGTGFKEDIHNNTDNKKQNNNISKSNSSKSKTSKHSNSSKINVFICGAVNKPGVYNLNSDAIVDDALKLAGGFREDADITYINLAMKLSDEDKIYIPTINEVSSNNESNSLASESDVDNSNLVNINTASKEELMTLTGIGESKATKIIDYRQNNGSFKKPEDLMNIPGIKDGVFNKIKDEIRV